MINDTLDKQKPLLERMDIDVIHGFYFNIYNFNIKLSYYPI